MHPVWQKAKGKGKARETVAAPGTGKTYRAPRPHPAKTNTKVQGLMTNVPVAAYREADSPARAGIRKLLQEDLDVLTADAEKKSGKRKMSPTHGAGSSTNDGEDTGGSRSATTNAPATPRFNSKGKPLPQASPEDLLTGDRDGSEQAKLLVSPISLGRTAKRLAAAART